MTRSLGTRSPGRMSPETMAAARESATTRYRGLLRATPVGIDRSIPRASDADTRVVARGRYRAAVPDQPQDSGTATGRGRPTRGASIGAGLGAACAVIAAPTTLVLAALLGVGGTGLIVLAAVFAVVLAALAVAARNIVTAVLAAVLALTAAIGAGG